MTWLHFHYLMWNQTIGAQDFGRVGFLAFSLELGHSKKVVMEIWAFQVLLQTWSVWNTCNVKVCGTLDLVVWWGNIFLKEHTSLCQISSLQEKVEYLFDDTLEFFLEFTLNLFSQNSLLPQCGNFLENNNSPFPIQVLVTQLRSVAPLISSLFDVPFLQDQQLQVWSLDSCPTDIPLSSQS